MTTKGSLGRPTMRECRSPHAGAGEKAESSGSSSNTGGDRDGKDDPVGDDVTAADSLLPSCLPLPFPLFSLLSLPVPSSFFFLLFFPFPLLPSSYLFYETGERSPGTCTCQVATLSPGYILVRYGCSWPSGWRMKVLLHLPQEAREV